MRVVPKLTADLKKPFKLEGITRVDDTPIHRAIREAVVNMIIHADYFISGESKARNPHIQTMLRFIGYGDNAGSGFPTIIKAWQKENWRVPDLIEDTELQQITLKLWMISLMPDDCIEDEPNHEKSGSKGVTKKTKEQYEKIIENL